MVQIAACPSCETSFKKAFAKIIPTTDARGETFNAVFIVCPHCNATLGAQLNPYDLQPRKEG